ncbi:hypothetical protein ED21_31549 [Erythrobacter sp. SD-21]|nr:hypothetical protein ED21_31549 [Erythrobacter sp. SD-21]
MDQRLGFGGEQLADINAHTARIVARTISVGMGGKRCIIAPAPADYERAEPERRCRFVVQRRQRKRKNDHPFRQVR